MHITIFGRSSLLVALALPFTTAPALVGAEPTRWKKAEAGHYAEKKTVCVSCHTVLPYALARPVLRQLTGVGQPTDSEQQLLGQTKLRVEHWEDLDSRPFRLLYDFNEAKKLESWGTEAVLNAFLLAFDDRYQGRRRPSDSTKRAFANLWRVQASDGAQRGSWDWLNFQLEPWESGGARYFGAALAAVAVGTAPGYYRPGSDVDLDQKVQRLRGYLHEHRGAQNLYNRAWLLWAANGFDGLLTPEERKTLIAELRETQQADGGWRLASLGAFVRSDGTPQDPASDGHATGLVLHVLQTVGVLPDDPNIAKGLSWLQAHQSPSGEWRGRSVNKKRDLATPAGRFMTDAATAYAVLALSH